jgi:hypothetical protein
MAISRTRQDLAIGLHTVTEFNQSIRYADTKAGGLAAVQALALTVLAARRDSASGATALLFVACLLGILVSAALLAVGQAPRLGRAGLTTAPTRNAFPSLSVMPQADVLAPPPLAAQHEQVWRQAAELAGIAMAKYRWLHRAMVSTLCSLAAVLLWLGCTTLVTPH